MKIEPRSKKSIEIALLTEGVLPLVEIKLVGTGLPGRYVRHRFDSANSSDFQSGRTDSLKSKPAKHTIDSISDIYRYLYYIGFYSDLLRNIYNGYNLL